jgi:uncharacterized coiled-coil protein SlyX
LEFGNFVISLIHSKQLTKQFDKINKFEQKVLKQDWSMKEQDTEINPLLNKISELEIRVANQEQYSRPTSIRFHNIKVTVDERGRIIHPEKYLTITCDFANHMRSAYVSFAYT